MIVRKAPGSNRLRRPSRPLGGGAFLRVDNRNRRLARDVEASIASADAFLYAASETVKGHIRMPMMLTAHDATAAPGA